MDMRGLAHFIRDIRNATSNKHDEEVRVDEELAKIRTRFLDTTRMTTYQRKKYVCKLMFVTMLGYPVTFGHMEALRLMAGETASEKLIGYLAMTVLLNEKSTLMTATTHTIYRDLVSGAHLRCSLALTAIANTGDRDLAAVVHVAVQQLLTDDATDLQLRKKAMLAMRRVYTRYAEVVDTATVVTATTRLLRQCAHTDTAVAMCATALLDVCVRDMTAAQRRDVTDALVDVLHNLIVAKAVEPGYVYYGVPAPWLQVKVLRLLPRVCDARAARAVTATAAAATTMRARVADTLHKMVKATAKVLSDAQAQQKQRGTRNRVCVMTAVLVEVVKLVLCWWGGHGAKADDASNNNNDNNDDNNDNNVDEDDDEDDGSKLTLECMQVIGTFLTDKREANMRYTGLALLAQLRRARPAVDFDFYAYCKLYWPHLLVSLHDGDVSIRRRALQVMAAACTPRNAHTILRELIAYLPLVSERAFKAELVHFIDDLAERSTRYNNNNNNNNNNKSNDDDDNNNGNNKQQSGNTGHVGRDKAVDDTTTTTMMSSSNSSRSNNMLLDHKLDDDGASAYTEAMLTVLAEAGDDGPVAVLRRVVECVVTNALVQKRACAHVYTLLRQQRAFAPQRMVRVAAFLLGEFGYQIALHAESTPRLQYALLHEQLVAATRSANASATDMTATAPDASSWSTSVEAATTKTTTASPSVCETAAALLTALMKMYHVYDDVVLRTRIAATLRACTRDTAPELQQRAREYVHLIDYANAALLDTVLQPCLPLQQQQQQQQQQQRWLSASQAAGATPPPRTRARVHEDDDANDTHATMPAAHAERVAVTTAKGGSDDSDKHVEVAAAAAAAAEQEEEAAAAQLEAFAQREARALRLAYAHPPQGNDTTRQTGDGGNNIAAQRLHADGNVSVQCTRTCCLADARLTITVRTHNATPLSSAVMDVLHIPAGLLLQMRVRARNRSDVDNAAHGNTPTRDLMVLTAPYATAQTTAMTTKPTTTDADAVIDVAARSIAPYVTAPSVQLRYTIANDATPHYVTLTLPLYTTDFVTPYGVSSPIDLAGLHAYNTAHTVTTSLTRTLSITPSMTGTRQSHMAIVRAALTSMGLTCSEDKGDDTDTRDTRIAAVGAHVTQRSEKVEYSIIACTVEANSDAYDASATLSVAVHTHDDALSAAVMTRLQQRMQQLAVQSTQARTTQHD